MKVLMGRLRLAAPAFLLLTVVSACTASRTGQLNGRWVTIAGPDSAAAGVAGPPTAARPLSITAPPPGCFDNATLASEFGPQCKENEPEAAATAALTDEVPLGNHPTPGEVRWYCDKRTVVRLVIERCGATNQFRVRQIALSIDGQR
jgi:hypothetical protein